MGGFPRPPMGMMGMGMMPMGGMGMPPRPMQQPPAPGPILSGFKKQGA